MNIGDQIHCIKPKNWWKIETTKLDELFSSFWSSWIAQIIRFNSDVFNTLENGLSKSSINLFNKVNPNTNSKLIRSFNDKENNDNFDKALIVEIEPEIISWQTIPILIESSIKVVKVLEMDDLFTEDIVEQKLYEYSINKSKTFEEFKKWFVEEFEKWRLSQKEFEQFNQLFYRKIQLLNN